MARRWRVVVVGFVVVTAVALAGILVLLRDTEPPEPGAFYSPPSSVPAGEPGQIIRSDELDVDVPAGGRAVRVLYASTDPSGEPTAVSGVVWVPAGSPPEGGRPVVAWAHPTTGVARRCAPSLFDDPAAKIPGLEALLEAGYVVAATDYPGLGTPGPHPYLVGESEGRAVLDSVRAARALPDTHASERVAVWGHSQGGHATLWSAALAADYAPELELVGVAAAAPATKLGELFRDDEGSLAGNLLSSLALVSWSEYYRADGADLDAIVEPRARDEVDGIAAGCIETNAEADLLGPDIAALSLGDLTADPTRTKPWSDLMERNSAPTRLDVPVFVAQGLKDTVVHPPITEEVVQTMCGEDVAVDFRAFPDASHETISREATTDVVAWIDARFAGDAAPRPAPTAERHPPLACGGPRRRLVRSRAGSSAG